MCCNVLGGRALLLRDKSISPSFGRSLAEVEPESRAAHFTLVAPSRRSTSLTQPTSSLIIYCSHSLLTEKTSYSSTLVLLTCSTSDDIFSLPRTKHDHERDHDGTRSHIRAFRDDGWYGSTRQAAESLRGTVKTDTGTGRPVQLLHLHEGRAAERRLFGLLVSCTVPRSAFKIGGRVKG